MTLKLKVSLLMSFSSKEYFKRGSDGTLRNAFDLILDFLYDKFFKKYCFQRSRKLPVPN